MAQHLEILKKGVPYWNEWRENNPNVIPDLIRADLQGLDLREANLYEANLCKACLVRANLIYADLEGANLFEANLEEANLLEADLYRANLIDANLTDAILPADKMNVSQSDGKRIKTINTDTYCINIYDNRIQIGCQNYTIDEWFAFTEYEIQEMANDALSFWKEWKPKLVQFLQ